MSDEIDDSLSAAGGEGHDDLLIVGIGASAGGIAALRQFFANVPENSGAAYAVILHLSPDHDSHLAEVLQATTSLPISQVQSRMKIERDRVYVIAPNASLSIADGHIVSAPLKRAEDRRAPVDLFFRTLADSHGRNAVSVVLSGTGPNGSSGLKRIKERGGLAIAQDPREAEYADMPSNSIATGLVDYVLPVAQIPAKALEYHRRLRQVTGVAPQRAHFGTEEDGLRVIFTQLRVRTGHDFTNYKRGTILRRIERRMTVLGLATLPDYAAFMQDNATEPTALLKELLISVTNFFRDPEVYVALERKIVPELFQSKRPLDQVRVWVAGCATGEEAYSIGMLLAEFAAALPEPPRIQIFASDLDDRAVAVAREGVYTDAEVADVSHERLQRFFLREAGGYRIRRELRELVLFAVHNVVKDPPFSHLDLLACRNLLIYLNRSIQERLFETFHFALRPGGFLLLGTSESPDGAGDLFVARDKDAHVYESRPVTSRLALPFGEPTFPRTPATEQRTNAPAVSERVFPIDLHHRLIEEYISPSLVVTDDHLLVHTSQHAGRYLHVGPGEPSRDVLQLIHPDLRLDLRTALYQAAQQRSSVSVRGSRLKTDHGEIAIAITVRPVLREDDSARGFFLIVFDEEPSTEGPAETIQLLSPAGDENLNLEEDLRRVKAQLGVTVQQYETQVEEAKASNEELQAANEELRSSAEELETSKEELQSVNEELTTVNQELKIKVEELRMMNNDFQNFINATRVPTIFLNRELRVKFSTIGAQDIFNLLPTDVGRPLSDITSKITYGGILEDATHVLQRLHSVEREVRTRDNAVYLMRVLPYRTLDDRIDGVAITFLDVTTLRQAEAGVSQSEERLRLLIDSAVDYAIFTMSGEGIIDSWNSGAERMWGYRADAIIGKSFAELFIVEDRKGGVPANELGRARREGRATDERFHVRQDGTVFFASGVTTPLGEGGRLGFAKIARDLTAPRESAAALDRAHQDAEDRFNLRIGELARGAEQVRRLLGKVVSAQEDERRRVARDLHDQLGQRLTALSLTLERSQEKRSTGEDAGEELTRALEIAAHLSKDIDFLAWELRPAVLDDLGLAAALTSFVQGWSAHYGIEGEFRVLRFSPEDLGKEAEVTFYRIAQEALNNVLKHARAHRADVLLETRDGQVTLIVSDDGVGFDSTDEDVASSGLGLLGMKERAALVGADLDVESTPGHGTTVYLRVDVANKSKDEPAPSEG